ncbi:mCG1035249 [Mus musculus]|jgi:hypothetical protein|nr:mCG1035249 [Mus musculus]
MKEEKAMQHRPSLCFPAEHIALYHDVLIHSPEMTAGNYQLRTLSPNKQPPLGWLGHYVIVMEGLAYFPGSSERAELMAHK